MNIWIYKRDRKKILSAADANGDGIIPPEIATDSETAQFLKDIIATVGGAADAGGRNGVTEAGLKQFLDEAAAFVAWHDRGLIPEGEEHTPLMPLGAETEQVFTAFAAVRDKVDEFFHVCATVAYDAGAGPSFRLEAGTTEGLGDRLRAAPCAPVTPGGALNLQGPLNPLYEKPLRALAQSVLSPVLGNEVQVLTREGWERVCATLDAHVTWKAERPATSVESLGPDRLRGYLAPRFRDEVLAFIEADRQVAEELDAGAQVEKLILYQRWILEFANNFVSFAYLYAPEERALFELGTLIMDGRQFALSTRVENRATHAQTVQNSRLFILYLELTQHADGEKVELATAVTSGGKGNLWVGKHGLFIDRDGRQRDARVVQIIENPISLREALLMPFRRIGQLVQSQVEKFSGSGQKALEDQVGRQAATAGAGIQSAVQTQPPTPGQAAAPPTHTARDFLVVGSVAVAALGTAFAYITKTLAAVKNPWTIATVFGVIVLLVLVPTVIIAWIKLRGRDVGALLEASGWAINGRIRLTRVMNGVFTRRPGLPKGAKKQRLDVLEKYARYATRPMVTVGKQATKVGKDLVEGM